MELADFYFENSKQYYSEIIDVTLHNRRVFHHLYLLILTPMTMRMLTIKVIYKEIKNIPKYTYMRS